MFDRAGEELPLQVLREKAWAAVDVFLARHVLLRDSTPNLALIFGLVQGTMRGCFEFF